MTFSTLLVLRFPPWFLRQDGVEEPVFRYLGQALNESVVTIRQADGHMHVVYALEATSNVLNAALVSMVTLGVLLRIAEAADGKRSIVNQISRRQT